MSTEKPYNIELSDRAKTIFAKLDKTIRHQVQERLEWLAANVDEMRHLALKGEWRGYYKLRAGDYRIIYWIDRGERLIVVELIGNRRDVYDE